MWLAEPYGDWRIFSQDMDATHCETFTPRKDEIFGGTEERKDDE